MTDSPSDNRDTDIAEVSSKSSDRLEFLFDFHVDTAMPKALGADRSVQALAESRSGLNMVSPEQLCGIREGR